MHCATLSEKFQVGIPKALRTDLGLKAGQQFLFVAKGDSIVMIPRRDIKSARGMLKGANTENIRDRTERI